MKKIEYEEKIKVMNIDLEKLRIVIGKKTKIPFSTGCYEENNIWYLYNVGERQNLSVVESGDEERIFKFLYMITLGKLDR